jgi:hypothetical protein
MTRDRGSKPARAETGTGSVHESPGARSAIAKTPPPTERQIQRSILAMLGTCFPEVFATHVPNGAHLAGADTARFKQMGALKGDGLKVGFPDLILYWNHGHALVEVKRPGCAKRVSPDQKAVHARLEELGWPVTVVTSPGEVFALLKARGAPTNVREWREAA